MKGKQKRCFCCHELKPLWTYKRSGGGWFDLCPICRKSNKVQREGYHGKKPQSWYEYVLNKQGKSLVNSEWGISIIDNNMQFTLVSLVDKVSEPINYGALGFIVSDDGTIAETSISVDTETDLAYKGLGRKDIINKIKKLTGVPLVIGGSVWTIMNK